MSGSYYVFSQTHAHTYTFTPHTHAHTHTHTHSCTHAHTYVQMYIPACACVIYTAAPNQVPDVAVVMDSITLDGDNVTFTLSWGEPFNNFDPIVNYTVSCSGDVTYLPIFTTTDNTTRSYNLTSMTNYTFSVVATK